MGPRRGKTGVTQADVLALTGELAIMLRAGLALANALKVLIDMAHKPAVSSLIQQVLDDVKDGAPLSRALAREQQVFGDFYLNMVRSGEASGQLAPVLTRLVEHLERIRSLRESVLSASDLSAHPAGGSGRVAVRDAGLCGAAVRKAFHRPG